MSDTDFFCKRNIKRSNYCGLKNTRKLFGGYGTSIIPFQYGRFRCQRGKAGHYVNEGKKRGLEVRVCVGGAGLGREVLATEAEASRQGERVCEKKGNSDYINS